VTDAWLDGDQYDAYIGRWSRLVAREFVAWLAIARDVAWLDVGCGTGALSGAILDAAAPRDVRGIDASPDYVAVASARLAGKPFTAQVADATALPFEAATFDAVVSGLTLNFVTQPELAIAEMRRVARPGATVAFYLWDYAGQMQLLRRFWDVVVQLDPAARDRDEGVRFPLCAPARMRELADGAELRDIETRGFVVPTTFRDFDDLWRPFIGGQGPAPGYVATLDLRDLERLRDTLRASLPTAAGGSIALTARAWALRARA
jgi:SAM-dependent methyltransferase